jgi:diguanylate cyclase (GGDEF)-like protein
MGPMGLPAWESHAHADETAAVLATAATFRPVGSDKEQVARLNQWLEVALNNMARGLSMFDSRQRLILCNKVYRDIYNLPEELTRPGTPLADIVRYHVKRETGRDRPEDVEEQRKWIEHHVAELARGKIFTHTQNLSGGRTILVSNQPLSDGSWVDLQEDITERCQAEQRITWLACHDALTEIPNRFHFREQLDRALQGLGPGEGLAVHWIDLDHFKAINDDLGHPAGDAVLKAIGARLQAAVRKPDFVGRLGGDEFAVVQSGVTEEAQAVAFVERILSLFKETHQLMGHRVDIGASIGVALAPEHGMAADELLMKADIALYHAKSLGRGTYALFDPQQSYEKQARPRIEADLTVALQENQRELYPRDAGTQDIPLREIDITSTNVSWLSWRNLNMKSNRLKQLFVRTFIFGPYQRYLVLLLWMLFFPAVLALVALFAAHEARQDLREIGRQNIEQLDKLHANVTAAFAMLRSDVTAEPCSAEFLRQLRRVAFVPDGLNEFLYAPSGIITCSTSREHFDQPVHLGRPDVVGGVQFGTALWINRTLDDIGLSGVRATVTYNEPFAIVIPPQTLLSHARWLHEELVMVAPDGRSWHSAGDTKLYALTPASAFHETVCSKGGLYCLAMETTLPELFSAFWKEIIIGVVLAAIAAIWLATKARAVILKHWALEARFCRYFDARSLVCAYQPIMDLRTGAISGCEVLSRWRDVDGSILYPDKFIPIVERAKMTRKFTDVVVNKAFDELTTHIPPDARLQVNFNVFPCDLDCAALCEVFSVFEAVRDRFDIVVEIVESDVLSFEKAREEIEALKRAGIKTYIDDFGAGYSNIRNLASLAVYGVKLDRAFAMAPRDSMLAKMLIHALKMVQATGHAILVEGVEDEERLELLKSTGEVDYVQGYLISRPIPIERFVELLVEHSTTTTKKRHREEATLPNFEPQHHPQAIGDDRARGVSCL